MRILLPGFLLVMVSLAAAQSFNGPLRVSPANPRYFTDDSGKAIYLTGAHNWDVMRDSGLLDPPLPFNYGAFLDLLAADNHNFLRFWVWDLPKSECDNDGRIFYITPFPWPRTGPGLANDGKPKFDLSQLDESYFTRLRARVIEAGEHGMYVGIMLFDGYGPQFCRIPNDGHPFDGTNNINGVSPASNVYTLNNPAALAIQKTYARKIVDTVNDLDNVLYEIANEAGVATTLWQFEMINTINAHQATKPRRHPVGMTFQHAGGDNATLFASPADWISPGGTMPGGGPVPYGTDPPAADGSKVILSDTDHIWGISPGASSSWVWRSFTRGLNTLYMNPLNNTDPVHPEIRRAMGQTIDYAKRLNLNEMVPNGSLTNTAHCLAKPGSEYLVYQQFGGNFTLNLGSTVRTYRVEWFRPSTGIYSLGAQLTASGNQTFTPPFGGPAVLYLRNTSLPPEDSIKVSIIDPTPGEMFTGDSTDIPILAKATDRYGNITQVEFVVSNQLIGGTQAVPHQFTWQDAPTGSHSIVARATNNIGQTVNSTAVTITVARSPKIGLFNLNAGLASFLLLGELGPQYRVEVSEDLDDWETLVDTPLYSMPGITGAAAVITDPGSVSKTRRFYRARALP